jgi:hypothetical protein
VDRLVRPLALLSLISAPALCVACSTEESSADRCAPGPCSHDSCASIVNCAANADCPLGTRCDQGECKVDPFPVTEDDSLVTGFDVPEFSLRVTDTAPMTFEWLAPKHAVRVTCALLTSPPEFPTISKRSERALIRMTNANRAIERQRTFNTGLTSTNEGFSFTLGELGPLDSGMREGCAVPGALFQAPQKTYYPIVEVLRVGCWAFDSVKVVAATRLVAIPSQSMPESGNVPLALCDAQATGAWCKRAGQPGTCRSQTCDTNMPTFSQGRAPDAAAGAPGTDTPSSLVVIVDCKGQTDGTSCVEPVTASEAFGQCQSGQCLRANEQQYRPVVVTSCVDGSFDGLNCYPTAVLSFGNCDSGTCLPRCRVDDDCKQAFEEAGLAPTLPRCDRNPSAYLGLCQARRP